MGPSSSFWIGSHIGRDKTSGIGQTESRFGGTETARVSQSIELGHTDLQFSVRLRITCAMALAKSVEPISTTRSVRDGFGGNLTLNFQSTTKLRSDFAV